MFYRFILIVGVFLFGLKQSGGQVVATRVLRDSLFIPWEIIYGPDHHLWFTQKNGYVCRMDTAGARLDTLLHEPTTTAIGESGMLGMALHPDFDKSPYVYVVWEYVRLPDSALRERIERYTFDGVTNKLVAPFILLDSIKGYKYHNGCRLLIAGDKLFATVADATDTVNSQNLSNNNGKVLRLNLDGTIPADNPIPGSAIWSWGHRNQQGLAMVNDILYSSEHGANTDDEINIIDKGGNYGWPYVRGFCDKPSESTFCADSDVVAPLRSWTPTIAPCGLDYYDHPLFPSLGNSLLLTTLKDKHLYQLRLSNDGKRIWSAEIVDGINFGRLRDICVSPEGKIYLTTSNSNSDGKPPFIDKIIEVTNGAGTYTKQTELEIYPNPAQEYVYLVAPLTGQSLVYSLSDEWGKIVMKGAITRLKQRISIGQLPSGWYKVVLYEDGRQVYKGRFVHTH